MESKQESTFRALGMSTTFDYELRISFYNNNNLTTVQGLINGKLYVPSDDGFKLVQSRTIKEWHQGDKIHELYNALRAYGYQYRTSRGELERIDAIYDDEGNTDVDVILKVPRSAFLEHDIIA